MRRTYAFFFFKKKRELKTATKLIAVFIKRPLNKQLALEYTLDQIKYKDSILMAKITNTYTSIHYKQLYFLITLGTRM